MPTTGWASLTCRKTRSRMRSRSCKAIALKPNYARVYNNLGSTLAQKGDLAEAIQAFEAGLKQAPDDLQLHLNLGLALGKKGDAEAAIVHFQNVLEKEPENVDLLFQLGQTLRQ